MIYFMENNIIIRRMQETDPQIFSNEEIVLTRSKIVCIGVGLHAGYGSAQRMYVKRGYIPDGSGVWYRDQICTPYGDCCNDDDLVLYLSKELD